MDRQALTPSATDKQHVCLALTHAWRENLYNKLAKYCKYVSQQKVSQEENIPLLQARLRISRKSPQLISFEKISRIDYLSQVISCGPCMLARRKALQRILKILMQKEEKYVLKAKGEVEKKRVSKMAGAR